MKAEFNQNRISGMTISTRVMIPASQFGTAGMDLDDLLKTCTQSQIRFSSNFGSSQ